MGAVDNLSALAEQTYTMSWRQAVKAERKMLLVALGLQAWALLSATADKLALLSVVLLAFGVISTALSRHLSRVRVSKTGIRDGYSTRVMKWEEINGVTSHNLGGVVLQSTLCPSIGVRSPILTNEVFRQQVLGLLPIDHVFAKQLREETSETEKPG